VAGGLREADPRRAATANNLGFVLHAQGRPAEALPLYEEALRLREAGLGPADPLVAQSLNNLAEALRALGRPGEAEPLHRRAAAVRRESLGARHPDAAQSLNNLGVLLAELGRYDEAEAAYRDALGAASPALGPDHPSGGRDDGEPRRPWPTLAATCPRRSCSTRGARRWRSAPAAGDPGLALTPGEPRRDPLQAGPAGGGGAAAGAGARDPGRALGDARARRRRRGTSSRWRSAAAPPATGEASPGRRALLRRASRAGAAVRPGFARGRRRTLADLAEVLRRRGQPDAALPHLARVLAIHESAARDGVGGRDLAAILNNLALLHYRRGAYLDAEPLLARAVLVESQALGPDHPDLAVTLENHAAVLLELERREEAEAALHRAKAVRIANAPAQTPPAQAR
jgi:tetratricopeptide (TPR) repeat protein